MTLKNALSFVLFVPFFFSCQKEEMMNEVVIDKNDVTPELINYKISEAEAKDILINFIDQIELNMSNDISSRSSASRRTIKDIQVLRADNDMISTYASENNTSLNIDTLMYLMNFDDEQGFAFVSADKRTIPVYAIIDEGSLSIDSLDKIDNPGFAIFMEEAINKQLYDIENNNSPVETYSSEISSRSASLWYITPKLKTKWGQRRPYDLYCNGCPTGCVITAAAQALSHFQTVSRVSWNDNGFSGSSYLNWNQIISDCEHSSDYGQLYLNHHLSSSHQVAHLMRYLGLSFKAKYSSGETEADTGDAVKFMKKWHGLSSSTGLKNYNANDVFKALLNTNNLVMVRANARYYHVGLFFKKYVDGHAWLIDGAYKIDYGLNSNKTKTYVHCNFGWNGQCDGYYLNDVFDTTAGPAIIMGSHDKGGTNEYNFKYKREYAILAK